MQLTLCTDFREGEPKLENIFLENITNNRRLKDTAVKAAEQNGAKLMCIVKGEKILSESDRVGPQVTRFGLTDFRITAQICPLRN